MRSSAASAWQWNAGLFRTDNRDDILFLADEQSGFGYFDNVAHTRRQGIELGMHATIGKLGASAHYTYLDATLQSELELNGAGNSSNDAALSGEPGFEGTIDVAPGARIPLIPRHAFKMQIDYAFSDALSASIDALALSGMYARGNENNHHEPDGVYYLGEGRTPGYVVCNLGIDYRPIDNMTLFLQINNAFDRRYYTAAQLGATGMRTDGTFIAQPFSAPIVDGELPLQHSTFLSPGAPRTMFIGVRFNSF